MLGLAGITAPRSRDSRGLHFFSAPGTLLARLPHGERDATRRAVGGRSDHGSNYAALGGAGGVQRVCVHAVARVHQGPLRMRARALGGVCCPTACQPWCADPPLQQPAQGGMRCRPRRVLLHPRVGMQVGGVKLSRLSPTCLGFDLRVRAVENCARELREGADLGSGARIARRWRALRPWRWSPPCPSMLPGRLRRSLSSF
jgi:hypothetical protein